ncbi:MAG: Crp/Fnr family transcriptional regulator [Bacteroidetes bacterium]|nr:Crp/Fnr family transcriptional regulator [Bacteroidota bacterium]
MYSHLIKHIRNYVPLSDEQAEMLCVHIRPIELKKKEHLLQEGEICRANYFVEQGGLCMYFNHEKGVEKLTQFAMEGWWISDYMSMALQKPATFGIKAFEDSLVLALDVEAQEKVYAELPQLERYFRLMMQRGYAAHQTRLRYIRERTAEETYLSFRSQFPDFVQRIPQYMLASYLGLTPEYLSELRKKDSTRIS